MSFMAALAPEALAAAGLEAGAANAVGTGLTIGSGGGGLSLAAAPGVTGSGLSLGAAPAGIGGGALGSGLGAYAPLASDLSGAASPFALSKAAPMMNMGALGGGMGLQGLGLLGQGAGMALGGNRPQGPMPAPGAPRPMESVPAGAFMASSPYAKMMAARGLMPMGPMF